MGLEPYQVTSALFGVIAQRLLRRKTPDGYRGRVPIAEFARADADLRKAVLERRDASDLARVLQTRPDYQTLRNAAEALVAQGITDAAEVRRVLGDSERG
jgi:type II secretory ATPase GspE/PulE/Tfp pilus assembly ATPase PilB-like protein